MADVRLVPMDGQAYAAWHGTTLEAYAREHARSDAMPYDEALALARGEFERLLPDGPASPGMHLFTALDGAGGGPVGMVWLGVRGTAKAPIGFIFDIQVWPERRGQGYGRALLAAVEPEARRLGLRRIALHVFGDNAVATRLYETSGYRVTDLQMAKDLA